MSRALGTLARPALLLLPPERAHEATLRSLERGLHPRPSGDDDLRLAVETLGLKLPNPFGIAAGFDKNARVPDAILDMGFGFAEVGTVTPQPQAGNPTPRIFRLIRDRAVINRLGFNNEGHQRTFERLAAREQRGVVGVNIGANKDSADRIGDYVEGIHAFYDVASYFAVNVSSPNTPGLRDLQAPDALDELLTRLFDTRRHAGQAGGPEKPIVVKLAPDIAREDLRPIAQCLLSHEVDGICVSNTTLARPALRSGAAREPGGLSGRPLFARATQMLARMHLLTEGRIALIGVGGIDSGAAALAKIEAGASLLQLYTGLIYEGPGLLPRMKAHLVETMDEIGATSLSSLTGRKAEEWAYRKLVE